MSKEKSKVLVVEDDQFLRKIYEVKLSDEGFNVKIAVDGEEGIKLALDFKPDVILLDLIMPKLNGFEVLEKLKGKEKIKTPIYVLSNLGQDSDVEKAKKLGAEGYLVKAVTPINEVVRTIRSSLK